MNRAKPKRANRRTRKTGGTMGRGRWHKKTNVQPVHRLHIHMPPGKQREPKKVGGRLETQVNEKK